MHEPNNHDADAYCPDPSRRALIALRAWAAVAGYEDIAAHPEISGLDMNVALIDLLFDLRVLCRRYDFDMGAAVTWSQKHIEDAIRTDRLLDDAT